MVVKAIRRALNLNPNERKNLTTLSLMGGMMAISAALAGMMWLVRYSWAKDQIVVLAPAILDGMMNLSYGMLGIMAIMTITQAAIALGGKIKGSFGPAEFEASQDRDQS